MKLGLEAAEGYSYQVAGGADPWSVKAIGGSAGGAVTSHIAIRGDALAASAKTRIGNHFDDVASNHRFTGGLIKGFGSASGHTASFRIKTGSAAYGGAGGELIRQVTDGEPGVDYGKVGGKGWAAGCPSHSERGGPVRLGRASPARSLHDPSGQCHDGRLRSGHHESDARQAAEEWAMIERLAKALIDKGVVKAPSEFRQTSYDPVEPRGTRSLACDLFLVAVGPEGAQLPSGTTAIDWMLRAAQLVELRLEGRIEVDGSGRRTTATVCDPHALGDPELDIALRHLNTGGPAKVVQKASVMPGARRVADRMLEDGLLVEESSTRLGLFTKTRLCPAPATGREELMDRLRSALRGASVPDDRTALLIAVFNEFLGFGSLAPDVPLEEARRSGEAVVARVEGDYRTLIDAVGFAKEREDSSGGGSAV